MLVIRREQMAALLAPHTRRLALDLAVRLARRFPERFPEASAPVTEAFVDRAITAALAHGITDRAQIATLTGLRAGYGERFEWTPVAARARALLEDATLPGAIKVAALERCLFDATGGRPVTVVFSDLAVDSQG